MARPRFQKADPAKQQAILKAAAKEFATVGYEGASVNRILEAAGLSKGGFYYYFDDKADLAATVLLWIYKDLFAFYDRLAVPDDPAKFWDAVAEFTRESMRMLDRTPHANELLSRLGHAFLNDKELAQRMMQSIAGPLASLNALWKKGQDIGAVRSDLPVPVLISLVQAAKEALMRALLPVDHVYTREELRPLHPSPPGHGPPYLRPRRGEALMTALTSTLLCLALAAAPAAKPAADAPPADVPACPSGSDAPDVAALVARNEKLLNGRSSESTFTMTIKTKDWTRSLKLQSWSRGKDYALVRVLEGGARETGMMTLKREKQLWNYLPQAGRVMKLPSGMMGDSWMGSDFTNDDLVKGSSLEEDYTSKVLGTEKHAQGDAWRIELKPKPDRPVVWGKVELLMDRKTCLPVRQVFFDEDGKPARTMEFADFRQVGWRSFPAKMTIVPAEAGRQTSISYEKIEFDQDIPDDTFALHRLRQGR
ncbi:MAG: DUF4292 domain-containing protein [Myxococcales bacterium]